MARSLISTGLLEIISNRRAENAKKPGKLPFPEMSNAISMDMMAGSTVEHRERAF
jgi:hypothetical protein